MRFPLLRLLYSRRVTVATDSKRRLTKAGRRDQSKRSRSGVFSGLMRVEPAWTNTNVSVAGIDQHQGRHAEMGG